jgi:hypothetical protein
MTTPGGAGTLRKALLRLHVLGAPVSIMGSELPRYGLRPLRYPGGGADTASGGGGKVPGGTIGWIVAVLVIIVVVYLIVQFVL